MVLPLVERVPPAPLRVPRFIAGAEPLVQLTNGKLWPIVLKVPLFTLMVIAPADEIVPAASGAVVVLVTLLNSKIAPPLVPAVSVPGVTCEPFSVTPRAAPSWTVMLPTPDFVP